MTFQPFDPAAQRAVVLAHAEARTLGHAFVGTEHLLLGVALVDDRLLDVAVERLRRALADRLGDERREPQPEATPYTAEALSAIQDAGVQALQRGQPHVGPGHILLALLASDTAAARMLADAGGSIDHARGAASTAAMQATTARWTVDRARRAFEAGDPVMLTLDRGLPLGDVGNPRVDAQMLLIMLAADGKVAAFLREHGLDEAAIRAAFPGL